jgi:hypothetical protein
MRLPACLQSAHYCTLDSILEDASLLTTQHRIYEDELHSAIEARSETLQALRELGPPDLVHLIKQPIKNATKQVRGPNPSNAAALADMRRRSACTIMSPE